MWIMLNDAFFSIVKKDCKEGELLVRARRSGDIEKVFGRDVKVDRVTVADYLYRAVLPFDTVADMLVEELRRVVYGNFKDTVKDRPLHDAYLRIWHAMAALQNPAPYSGRRSSYSGQGTLRYPDMGLPYHEIDDDDGPDDVPADEPVKAPNTKTADAMQWAGKAMAPYLPKEVPPSQAARAAKKKRVRK